MSTWRSASSLPNIRAGYAPRGGRGGRGGWKGAPQRQVPPQPDIVKNPLGNVVVEITTKALTASEDTLSTTAAITECEYVATYNWMNESVSTIMTPGEN